MSWLKLAGAWPMVLALALALTLEHPLWGLLLWAVLPAIFWSTCRPTQPIYRLSGGLADGLLLGPYALVWVGVFPLVILPAMLLLSRHLRLLVWLVPLLAIVAVCRLASGLLPNQRPVELLFVCLVGWWLALVVLDPTPVSLAAVVSLLPAAGFLRHWTRRDLWCLRVRPRTQSLPLAESQGDPRSRFRAALASVARPVREAFLPPAGEEELFSLLAAGPSAEQRAHLAPRYLDLAQRLFHSLADDDAEDFAGRYSDFWRKHLVPLAGDRLWATLEQLEALAEDGEPGADEGLLMLQELLASRPLDCEEPPWQGAAEERASVEIGLIRLVAAALRGCYATDLEDLDRLRAQPCPAPLEDLCRRLLAHAVDFQEGSFIRELIQNVLDEAARTGAGLSRRRVEIRCGLDAERHLVVQLTDHLGMSQETVLQYLLVPNRSTKSPADGAAIGRFGQGFFTVLRGAGSVQVHTVERCDEGRLRGLLTELIPERVHGELEDVRARFVPLTDGDITREGTTVRWRSDEPVDEARLARTRVEILTELQWIPVEELRIELDGRRFQKLAPNLAQVPTPLGAMSLHAAGTGDLDLLVTQRNLLVTRVSRHLFTAAFPGVPEKPITEVLFVGGLILDLPAGLPLNRTRTAVAARGIFASALAHEVVRLGLLAVVEAHLRGLGGHEKLASLGWIPKDYFGDGQDKAERDLDPWLKRAGWLEDQAVRMADQVASGESFLEPQKRSPLAPQVPRELPCLRDRATGGLVRLSQAARSPSLARLLCFELPHPSRPVGARLVGSRRLGWSGHLFRGLFLAAWGLVIFSILASSLLLLMVPLSYAGRYSGWAVFGGFTLVAGLWLAAAILHRRFLRVAVRLTAEASTVYDVLGRLSQRTADLLLPGKVRGVYLFHRPGLTLASAVARWGSVRWNGWRARGPFYPRHLQAFLNRRGDFETPGFAGWLHRFLLVLTHELAHVNGRKAHDKDFFDEQRRLLEKVLAHEEEITRLFRTAARQTPRARWAPSWGLVLWRRMRGHDWERVS